MGWQVPTRGYIAGAMKSEERPEKPTVPDPGIQVGMENWQAFLVAVVVAITAGFAMVAWYAAWGYPIW